MKINKEDIYEFIFEGEEERYQIGDLAGHDLELIENVIEKAINILVENGLKKEHAEDEFKCLSNPLEDAVKIINDKEFVKGYVEGLMFVFEDEYKSLSEKEILKRRYKELENEYFDALEEIETKTKDKIKELNNGKLSYKELSQENADKVIAYRKELFKTSNMGKVKSKMNKIDKKIRSIKGV